MRYLKKSHRDRKQAATPKMKYQFIERERQNYPVVVLCKMLEVSESGYYAWRKRQPSQHTHEADNELAIQVESVFEQSRQTYGSPRVHAALHTNGISCSRRQVARLMRKKGLVSCWRRKKKFKVCTTDNQHDQPVAPNRHNH